MPSLAADLPSPVNPLWKDSKIKNYLPYMTWSEVEALLKKSDMVIIPVGAMEQHGLGGPIGTMPATGPPRPSPSSISASQASRNRRAVFSTRSP
jgi:hypothetical protein